MHRKWTAACAAIAVTTMSFGCVVFHTDEVVLIEPKYSYIRDDNIALSPEPIETPVSSKTDEIEFGPTAFSTTFYPLK